MVDPNNQTSDSNPVGRFMVAVGAVIEHAETHKILVIKRSEKLDWQPGKWEMMYGRIAQFEDTKMGLQREAREELGLENLEVEDVLRAWHVFRGSQKAENEVVGITFHCFTTQEKIILSEEHSEYRWVTPLEALKLITEPSLLTEVEFFIQHQKNRGLQVGRDVIGVGVGALIFNDEGKLLLSLRGKKARNEVGKWEIPGGSVEFGETIEQALKREIKEEIGVEVSVGEMLQLCDHIIHEDSQHWVSPTYICKIVSGTPTIQEPEKCERLGWFTLDEAERLPLSIITKQDIKALQEKGGR